MDDLTQPLHTREVSTPECRAVSELLGRVGEKWTVLVLGQISRGTIRYSDLRRKVDGISQRMLTLTLKGLERDGLISRRVYPTVPPRVEYDATPLGLSLNQPLSVLFDWVVQHRAEMEQARLHYEQQKE